MIEPFNGENNCVSVAIDSDKNNGIDNQKNMLTNLEEIYFTIEELEVWEVIFVEK
jgi:hypothetical protein